MTDEARCVECGDNIFRETRLCEAHYRAALDRVRGSMRRERAAARATTPKTAKWSGS